MRIRLLVSLIFLSAAVLLSLSIIALKNKPTSYFLALNQQQQLKIEFQDFKSAHNKEYFNEFEHNHRFKVFKSNKKLIKQLNYRSRESAPSTEFPYATFAINKFADLTVEEFERLYLGYRPDTCWQHQQHNLLKSKTTKSQRILRDYNTIDWRGKGKVTNVKDQGACGSCWAFSTTGSLQSANAIHGDGNLTELSEQQLIDCSSSYGNHGCDGGLMQNAWAYLQSYKLETENDYKYIGEDQTCSYQSNLGVIKIITYKEVEKGSQDALYNALVNGPISVAVDARHLMYYNGGIITKDFCQFTNLNHGVLLTGYKEDEFTRYNYWEVKNSWASNWGVQGYFKVEAFSDDDQNSNGTCGIALDPSYPVLH